MNDDKVNEEAEWVYEHGGGAVHDTEPDPADYASDDFAWPSVKDLRPVDALRLLDDVEAQAREANRRADTLKDRKAQAKNIALAVLEEYEQNSTNITTSAGRRVTYSTYPFDVFTVDNEEDFKAWADTQSESFYEPALRKQIFLDEMRRRDQDGEPLPPGVRKWTDTRLNRTVTQK